MLVVYDMLIDRSRLMNSGNLKFLNKSRKVHENKISTSKVVANINFIKNFFLLSQSVHYDCNV